MTIIEAKQQFGLGISNGRNTILQNFQGKRLCFVQNFRGSGISPVWIIYCILTHPRFLWADRLKFKIFI